ncbi:MAG: tetratricopeptide repeat protein [Acidobacteriota bacterium]
MNVIPHYCQNCATNNQLGERSCRKCGTRLMLVVFPPSIRHDEGIVPSFYEDHLLERVTLLEIRLSQVAERLAIALDLVLRQTKNTHSDHLLLETLIDSLNTLGAVEKDTLTQKWRNRIKKIDENEKSESKDEKLLREVTSQVVESKKDLFRRIISESLKLLSNNEDKQAFRTLERALEISPQNSRLLLFIAENYFLNDKSEAAKVYLEKILEIEKDNQKAKLLLATVLADLLKFDKAKIYLQELSAEQNFEFISNYILGTISAFQKDWKSSLDYLKVSVTVSNKPETHYLLGCVYFQLQKFKLALQHLQKAVETDTNFADAWFMLAVIYKLIGDETKSYQSIELAWSSKEAGAECLRFMKRGSQIEVEVALPFLRLIDLKKNLIMSNSLRFTKLIRGEVSKILND